MNICLLPSPIIWILKSFLALMVVSVSAQAALPPDNASVLYCEATSSTTNFKDYRIAWTYNSPPNTLLPDHIGGGWANGQFDESVLASASAQLVGSGMGYSFDFDKQTVIHLTGVDQASALDAYQANDFIEYQFTTKADMNQAQLFNGFAFASHNYTQNYKIDVLLSEDNFATATTVLSDYMVQPVQSPPNDNPWYQWIDFPTDNASYLKPDTTYKFRILFYGASNTNAVYWDDFHVSMGLCQDYSDAPATSYGAASHDQPRATTHYLGGAIADAETGVSDGGDAGVGADGDDTSGTRPDDEDGVVIPALTQGSSATLTATVSGAGGYLQGWIDWNGDGSFDNASGSNEIIAVALQDNANGGTANNTDTDVSNGIISFTVEVPADATTDQTYARFRWSTEASLDAITNASNGEVEDYPISITKVGVTVSGRVYRDTNVNALNDSTELGVTSLPVVLYDTVNKRCRSTRTNGSGHYTFEDVVPGTYQMYEASREKMPIPKYCDPAFAKDPSGYRSTTNKVREAFTVTTNDITGQDFGNVKLPIFEPDNTGQILPGNVLFYAHKFTTPTAGSVRFSSLSSTHRSRAWSSIIYRDENCDGKLNQSDGASPLGTGPVAVNANDNICLVNKVYAPSNVAANDQYIQNITADFDFENAIAGNVALTVRDVTTAQQVQTPALPATPEVIAEPVTPAQDPVDATPTTPYIPEIPEAPAQAQVDPTPVTPAVGPSRLELRKTVKNITQGTAETETVNSADPGNILEYRIYYSNTGTGPLSDLIVNDRVPAYTELVGVADCGMILPDMGCTASPLSLDDALQWTFTGQLPGGSGSSVSYQVVIDQ